MERPQNVMDVQADYRGRAFTAVLSAHEFWLALNKGFQPLGMVMGHSMFALGSLTRFMSTAKGNFPGEVKAYTDFMHQARMVAMARMQFEADELGAAGVIGVKIEVNFLHHNEWIQVNATGTAVRYVGTGYGEPGEVAIGARQPKVRERSTQRPQSVMDVQADYRGHAFTSNLSSEELWLMLEAGYEPLGVIISNGVSAMGQSLYWDMIFKTNFRGEVPRRFGVARGVAYDSMFAQARELGADTIIGVQYRTMFKLHYHSQWLECFIMGTAVRYVGKGPYQPSQLKKPPQASYPTEDPEMEEGPYQPSRLKKPPLMLQQATSQSRTAQNTRIQKIWPCGHMNRLGAHFCSVCGEVASTSLGG